MSEIRHTDFCDTDRPIFRSKWLPAMTISLTVAVFALVIWAVTSHLRAEIREEVIAREGMVFHSVAMMLEQEQAAELERTLLDEPSTQLDIVLKTSRLKGVIGTRLFDSRGKFHSSFPANVAEGAISEPEMARLKSLRVIGDFQPDVSLSRVYLEQTMPPGAELHGPLLDILIPLHFNAGSNLLGIAEFLVDGREVSAELGSIDRSLFNQAVSVFLGGGLLVALALRWAFRRLQRAHELLGDRTRNLLEASQALSFATKTSAVGVVTTHLLHELRSQLFGVQSLMEGHSKENSDPAWKAGVESAKRMQNLVKQLIEVIRHELGTNHQYEVSFKELTEIISAEVAPLAQAAEVRFVVEVKSPGVVSTHVASLLVIILTHLIQNAIQATPRRKSVQLSMVGGDDFISFEVCDEGPGFPPDKLDTLFKPVRSSKEGGSGIGLALCKQLAGHLGAELALERTGPNGCLFAVSMPTKLIAGKTVLAA